MSSIGNNYFLDSLEDALKHYPDAQWLGEHSPFATPYFLGVRLSPEKATPIGCGRSLQHLLNEACQQIDEQISNKYAARYRTLLQEYYFRNRAAGVVGDELGLSRNVFNISRNGAIEALAGRLIQLVQPALRLEQPPQATLLFERQSLLDQCAALLRQAKTLTVSGISGVGKSAFAAALARQLDRPTFWFTLRPGLNDQVESLLFALALFAHRRGVSNLWLELAAHTSAPALSQRLDERLLSSLRYALSQIQPSPLLCFDALDLLQPQLTSDHAILLQWLESLRGITPVIAIAHSAPLEADETITLAGLSPAGIVQLLGTTQLDLSPRFVADLQQLTHGNPRLLKLALTALDQGASLAELRDSLLTSSGVELLFAQTLQRLSNDERQLLMALCVFRSPVPRHFWQQQTQGAALTHLLDKGVLEQDAQGEVEVVWVYRQLLYHNLPDASRLQFHRQAARMRSQLGAATAAAYHWIHAGQPETAVTQWRAQQTSELAQGQAATALTLFRPLLNSGLATTVQEQVAIICAYLEYWTGQATRAVSTLQTTLIKTPILAIEADEITGMIANDHSEFERADHAFRRALQVSERLLELRVARLHKGRAWMHLRQRELDQAEQELNLAHYEVENMRGNLAMDRGHFAEAQQHYQLALQLAEALSAHEPIARTCINLAGIALFQGRCEESIALLERALHHYERAGKIADLASAHITLAVAYNQANRHADALDELDTAEQGLLAHSSMTSWQSGLIAQGRAEAWLGLGKWEEAERAVKQAIDAEEISLLPDAYRVCGEICCQRGDYATSERWLKQSLALAEENQDRYLAAYAWRALAQLYRVQNESTRAEAAYKQAIDHFEILDLANEVRRTEELLRP